MAIRSAAKAIIVRDGCMLLNRCRRDDGSVYYDLPGGGQRQYEALEDAVVREVREESGYAVRVTGFAALSEEICTHPALRAAWPDYTHRVLHMFRAEVIGGEPETPTELDPHMEGSVWVPLGEIGGLQVYPLNLTDRLAEVLAGEAPVFLGTYELDRESP